jgi:hypothetical protein
MFRAVETYPFGLGWREDWYQALSEDYSRVARIGMCELLNSWLSRYSASVLAPQFGHRQRARAPSPTASMGMRHAAQFGDAA